MKKSEEVKRNWCRLAAIAFKHISNLLEDIAKEV